jgi:hypothetical protein
MDKTAEAIPEAKTEAAPPSGSYFARHWRGDFSLPKSYWVNGALIFGLGCNFAVMLAVLATVAAFKGTPAVSVIVLLGEIALNVAAYIWAIVGIWRSAVKYQGPRVWSILARIGISFGVLLSIGRVLENLAAIGQLVGQ